MTKAEDRINAGEAGINDANLDLETAEDGGTGGIEGHVVHADSGHGSETSYIDETEAKASPVSNPSHKSDSKAGRLCLTLLQW